MTASNQWGQGAGGGLGGLLSTLLPGVGAATAAGMANKGGKVLPPGDELPSKSTALDGGGKSGAGGGFRDNDVDPRDPLGDPSALFRRR